MSYVTGHIVSAFKAAREKQAISQRELSTRSGVPQAQISRFENGTVDIRLSSIVALARALSLEVELVPRSAVHAVETLIRAENATGRSIPRAAATEIRKLTQTLKAAEENSALSVQAGRLLANLRMLERLQPSPSHLASIRKFNDLLRSAGPSNVDADTFAQHAGIIGQIRSELAQASAVAARPRPAYSLDDEDEDNE